jgi:iron complex outermembrane receptor protein
MAAAWFYTAGAAADSLTELDFLGDFPIALTVAKLPQPINETPASVTIINQAMIQASGFRDIPDLLRLVPGFSVAYTRNNTWAVGYHGLADAYSRRMQVLVDGRSIYGPHLGQVDWGTLPLAIEDIERIEVTRGPNAAIYGANAFVATINIVSKTAGQVPGGLVSAQLGEQDMAGLVLRYGGGEGDLRYRVTLSGQRRDRFEDTFNDPLGKSGGTYLEKSRTRFFNGRWDWQRTNTDELSVQVGLTAGDWDQGIVGNSFEAQQVSPRTYVIQGKYRRAISADEEWSLQAYTGYAKSGDPYTVEGLPAPVNDVVIYGRVEQWRDNLEFESRRAIGADWRLVWGAQLQHDAVRSQDVYPDGQIHEGTLGRTYFNTEWRASPHWLIQGGAMLEDHYFAGVTLSPRIAATWLLSPDHSLRASVSRAYRAPTFFEQEGGLAYYNSDGVLLDRITVPSNGLDPEAILSREIGYVGHIRPWALEIDVRLFYDLVTDYLGDQSVPSTEPQLTDSPPAKVFQYVNGGSLTRRGVDTQLTWRPSRSFDLRFSGGWVDIEVSDNIVDDDLPRSAPSFVGSLVVNWLPAERWRLSAGLYYNGEMYWLSDGDNTEEFLRFDARVARRFNFAGHDAEWALVGQSIGADYTEFRRENVFSPRVYGSLNVRF